jgi:inorganic phosphate transporter, PiT family
LVNTGYGGGIRPLPLLCAVLAAIVWNLLTWWLGLPSSSSHALIGGLCGAAIAAAGGDFSVVNWREGIWPKVAAPMIISPILGLVLGFLMMGLLVVLLRRWRPHRVNAVFGKLQLVSATFMGLSHGTNDAQKTMGIITLTLWTATQDGLFEGLPRWLGFLHTPHFEVALWVKVVCSVTIASGTAAGGWRIIRTLGHRMVKLQPIHGFAAETTAASVIHAASAFGIPLSTTHVISSAIMGVGATKRLNAVKWTVVGRMVCTWLLTLPTTAVLGYLLQRAFGGRLP